jgi:hypothetical protein
MSDAAPVYPATKPCINITYAARNASESQNGLTHREVPPNVQDEPRPWLARLVLLGARDVTAMVVGSGALLGSNVTCRSNMDCCPETIEASKGIPLRGQR